MGCGLSSPNSEPLEEVSLKRRPFTASELPAALQKLRLLFDEVALVHSGNDRQEAILNFGTSADSGQQLLGYRGQLYLQADGVTQEQLEASREFVTVVFRSLHTAGIKWHHPVVKPIKGALTRRHTDVFRGNTTNDCLFLEIVADSGVVFRKDIQFRTSVVTVDGTEFIPFAYWPEEKEDEDVVTLIGRKQDGGTGVDVYVFNHDVMDRFVPVGELTDHIVVSKQEDELWAMPRDGRAEAPLVLVTFDAMVEEARRHPLPNTGLQTERVGEAGVWCGFEGWRFLHWFEGNPDARRIHLVNRAMDRPDGSVIDLEDTDSFIDMREPLPPGVVRAASNSAWPQGPEGVPEGVKVIDTLLDVMPIVFKAKRKFLALSRSRSKRTLNVEKDVVVDGIP